MIESRGNPSEIRVIKTPNLNNILNEAMQDEKNILFHMMLFAVFLGVGFSAEFKVYPGAIIEEEATNEAQALAAMAKQNSGKSTIYVTKDPFLKVAAFYKNIGKEVSMPRSSGTTGKPKKYEQYDLWEAYFVLDGAANLSTSRCWVKVQRPFIGEEVKNITAITVVVKQ